MTASANLTCLEAARLPELYRKVCVHAGVPLASAPGSAERFVFRCGIEPPELFPELLEEAFAEDAGEVPVCLGVGAVQAGNRAMPIAVRPGYPSPCPNAEELRRAVAPAGPVLLFAIERRDADLPLHQQPAPALFDHLAIVFAPVEIAFVPGEP